MPSSKATVSEIVRATIELTRAHAVWWLLADRATVEKHRLVFDKYPNFFATVREALFQEIFIITRLIFDPDPQTKSIPNLLKELDLSYPSLACKLRDDIRTIQPILDSIFLVRHNVYAHRNKKRLASDFFKSAALTPKKLASTLPIIQSVVSSLALVAAHRVDFPVFGSLARSEGLQLLDSHPHSPIE
jgi:hypothetical protein